MWNNIQLGPLRIIILKVKSILIILKVRDTVSGRKKIVDVNDSRRAVQLAASHPQWSAEQIANDFARRGSALVSKWTIGRILAQ